MLFRSESFLRSSHYIEKLAAMGQLDSDDDPRIRELTEEEEDVLTEYFRLGSEIGMIKRIVDVSDLIPCPFSVRLEIRCSFLQTLTGYGRSVRKHESHTNRERRIAKA